MEPGGETTLTIVLKDAAGQPVPDGELAVVVVDEAILALTNYQLTDPLSAFYTDRPSYLESLFGRSSIVLVDPQALANAGLAAQDVVKNGEESKVLALPAAAPQATATAGNSRYQMGHARTNPCPHQLQSPGNLCTSVKTDSNGEARVLITLPDNLISLPDHGGRS